MQQQVSLTKEKSKEVDFPITICNCCNEYEIKCGMCDSKINIESGDKFVYYEKHTRIVHFCSKKCIMEYFEKNLIETGSTRVLKEKM